MDITERPEETDDEEEIDKEVEELQTLYLSFAQKREIRGCLPPKMIGELISEFILPQIRKSRQSYFEKMTELFKQELKKQVEPFVDEMKRIKDVAEDINKDKEDLHRKLKNQYERSDEMRKTHMKQLLFLKNLVKDAGASSEECKSLQSLMEASRSVKCALVSTAQEIVKEHNLREQLSGQKNLEGGNLDKRQNNIKKARNALRAFDLSEQLNTDSVGVDKDFFQKQINKLKAELEDRKKFFRVVQTERDTLLKQRNEREEEINKKRSDILSDHSLAVTEIDDIIENHKEPKEVWEALFLKHNHLKSDYEKNANETKENLEKKEKIAMEAFQELEKAYKENNELQMKISQAREEIESLKGEKAKSEGIITRLNEQLERTMKVAQQNLKRSDSIPNNMVPTPSPKTQEDASSKTVPVSEVDQRTENSTSQTEESKNVETSKVSKNEKKDKVKVEEKTTSDTKGKKKRRNSISKTPKVENGKKVEKKDKKLVDDDQKSNDKTARKKPEKKSPESNKNKDDIIAKRSIQYITSYVQTENEVIDANLYRLLDEEKKKLIEENNMINNFLNIKDKKIASLTEEAELGWEEVERLDVKHEDLKVERNMLLAEIEELRLKFTELSTETPISNDSFDIRRSNSSIKPRKLVENFEIRRANSHQRPTPVRARTMIGLLSQNILKRKSNVQSLTSESRKQFLGDEFNRSSSSIDTNRSSNSLDINMKDHTDNKYEDDLQSTSSKGSTNENLNELAEKKLAETQVQEPGNKRRSILHSVRMTETNDISPRKPSMKRPRQSRLTFIQTDVEAESAGDRISDDQRRPSHKAVETIRARAMGRNDRSTRISFIDHDSDSEMSTESVISDERRKTTRAVEKVRERAMGHMQTRRKSEAKNLRNLNSDIEKLRVELLAARLALKHSHKDNSEYNASADYEFNELILSTEQNSGKPLEKQTLVEKSLLGLGITICLESNRFWDINYDAPTKAVQSITFEHIKALTLDLASDKRKYEDYNTCVGAFVTSGNQNIPPVKAAKVRELYQVSSKLHVVLCSRQEIIKNQAVYRWNVLTYGLIGRNINRRKQFVATFQQEPCARNENVLISLYEAFSTVYDDAIGKAHHWLKRLQFHRWTLDGMMSELAACISILSGHCTLIENSTESSSFVEKSINRFLSKPKLRDIANVPLKEQREYSALYSPRRQGKRQIPKQKGNKERPDDEGPILYDSETPKPKQTSNGLVTTFAPKKQIQKDNHNIIKIISPTVPLKLAEEIGLKRECEQDSEDDYREFGFLADEKTKYQVHQVVSARDYCRPKTASVLSCPSPRQRPNTARPGI